MTVSATQTKTGYVGDGATTVFPVPFIFFNGNELLIIETVTATGVETTKSYNVDYTVSGGNGNNGTVIAVAAPSASVTWTIKRNTALTQLVDYTPNDPFPAETHERALDRLTAIVQEQQELIGRNITIPISSSLSNIQIPLPGNSKFWRWNAAGTAIEAVDIVSIGLIGLPVSITDGGTSATTKDVALANFNLSCLRAVKFRNFY